MKLIDRYEKCIGLTLWSKGRRHIELWYCPSGYTIEKHSHPDEDIELMFLFGNAIFHRMLEDGKQYAEYKPKWYHIGKVFTVLAGTLHWFSVSKLPLIFINFSTFKEGKKTRSAAHDFQKTQLGLWVK